MGWEIPRFIHPDDGPTPPEIDEHRRVVADHAGPVAVAEVGQEEQHRLRTAVIATGEWNRTRCTRIL